MPIVSGFVVPKMNPTSHVGNIRLLRLVVVTVEHQEDSQAENYESKDKEEPEEILHIVSEVGSVVLLVPFLNLHIPEHTRSAFRVCSQQSEVQK